MKFSTTSALILATASFTYAINLNNIPTCGLACAGNPTVQAALASKDCFTNAISGNAGCLCDGSEDKYILALNDCAKSSCSADDYTKAKNEVDTLCPNDYLNNLVSSASSGAATVASTTPAATSAPAQATSSPTASQAVAATTSSGAPQASTPPSEHSPSSYDDAEDDDEDCEEDDEEDECEADYVEATPSNTQIIQLPSPKPSTGTVSPRPSSNGTNTISVKPSPTTSKVTTFTGAASKKDFAGLGLLALVGLAAL